MQTSKINGSNGNASAEQTPTGEPSEADRLASAYTSERDSTARKLASDPNEAAKVARQIGRADARADFARTIRAKLAGVRGR